MIEFTFSTILFFIGYIITSFVPIAYSLYKETRYTDKINMILYGAASIGFGLLYYGDTNISSQLYFLKIWSLIISIVMGTISIIVGIKVEDGEENVLTLILSAKQFGAFQLAFVYSIFFGLPPVLIPQLPLPSIFDLAIVFLIIFNLISLAVFVLRKFL